MKSRSLFILIFCFAVAASASAQNKRTVTNEDLEKFRQKRLAAERDYRENYERMGFPSPEELQKQIEKSRIERSQLAARLEAERVERDRLSLERERAAVEARRSNLQYQTPYYQVYPSDYFGGYGYPTFGYSNFSYSNRRYSNRGYGGFVNFPNFGGFYNRVNRSGAFAGFPGGLPNYNPNYQLGNYGNPSPAPRRILAPGERRR